MYLEIDDDDDSDNGDTSSDTDDICVTTCVKHVMFLSTVPPYDIFKLVKVSDISM